MSLGTRVVTQEWTEKLTTRTTSKSVETNLYFLDQGQPKAIICCLSYTSFVLYTSDFMLGS